MEIGQTFTVKKSITDKLIVDFSEISGDRNPLHLDEDYAKNTIFKKRIAHGMLIGSFFLQYWLMIFQEKGPFIFLRN